MSQQEYMGRDPSMRELEEKQRMLIGDNSLASINRIDMGRSVNDSAVGQSQDGGHESSSAVDSQVEQVVSNMWSRMKNLEGKYIDLANYYKQELLNKQNSASDGTSSSAGRGAVSLPLKNQENSNLNEDQIINDLKNEKIQFEANIKQLLNERSGSSSVGVFLTNEEILRFNNELQGAFKDILNNVEKSSILSVNNLGQRQTEMFQLATKYRLASGFKNDAIGVWYDAKSQITNSMGELRRYIQEKSISIQSQAIKPMNMEQDKSGLNKENYKDLLTKFEDDLLSLKRNSKDYSRSILKIQQSIKAQDEIIKKDKQTSKVDFQHMIDAVVATNEILNGRKNLISDANSGERTSDIAAQVNHGSSRNSQLSLQNQQVMSPFEKRMGSYQKSAMNRSSSKGPDPKQTSKPPKLGMQSSTGSRMGRKPSTSGASGLTSPIRSQEHVYNRNSALPDTEWNPDLREIRNRLQAYESSVNRLLQNHMEKEQQVNDMVMKVENHIQKAVNKFISTHDQDMVRQYFTNIVLTPTEVGQIVSKINIQEKQSQNSQSSKQLTQTQTRSGASRSPMRKSTTPTRLGKSGKSHYSNAMNTPTKGASFTASGEPGALDGLGSISSNQAQVFTELRKTNEKYMEQQVENKRLKDQVQLLSLQIEDLRMHNNRMQQQSSSIHQSTFAQRQKKTRTSRGGPSGTSVSDMVSPIRGGESNKTHSQSIENLQIEEIDLCKKVDSFFSAMKHLQRAVNKKEDISELKVEFETKQRALQKMSKAIQQRPQPSLTLQKSRTYMEGQSLHSEETKTVTRNRSTNKLTTTQKAQMSSSHRLSSSPMSRGGSFRPKTSGTKTANMSPKISAKGRASSNRPLNNSTLGGAPLNDSVNKSAKALTVNEQNEIINNQKQQLIVYDKQLQQAKTQIQALQGNTRLTMQQRDELQRLIIDYKDAFDLIEEDIKSKSDQITDDRVLELCNFINSLKAELAQKYKHPPSQQVIDQKAFSQLKSQLINRIKQNEMILDQQYTLLHDRLQQRESELAQVKKLFVQKLRELETNFAEIGDHLIANQEDKQKQAQQSPKANGQQLLQNFLSEQSDTVQQDDKVVEELSQANQQLNDQINELKNKYKDYVSGEQNLEMQSKINDLETQIKTLNKDKQHLVKMFDQLTKERDTAREEQATSKQEKKMMEVEISKMKEISQQIKIDFQNKEMMIEETLKKYQSQLKDEMDQKNCFEKEARDNTRLAKLQEEEIEALQQQIDELEMESVHMKHALDEGKKKMLEKIEEVEQIKSMYNELKVESAEKSDQLLEEQEKLKFQIKRNETLQEHSDQLELDIERQEQEIENKQNEIDSLKDISESTEEISKLKEQLEEIEKQKQSLENDKSSMKQSISELQEKENQIQAELRRTEEEKAQVQQKMEQDLIAAETEKAEYERKVQEAKEKAQKEMDQAKEKAKEAERLAQEEKAKAQKELQDAKELAESEKIESEKRIQEAKDQLEIERAEAEHKIQQVHEKAELQIRESKAEIDQLQIEVEKARRAHQELQQRLDGEISNEQAQLLAQLESFKNKSTDLESQVQKAAKEKMQNWWAQALQLKCKKLVAERMRKEQMEAERIKAELEQRSKEQESISQQAQKLKEELEHKTKLQEQEALAAEEDRAEIERQSEQQRKEFEEYRSQVKEEIMNKNKEKEDVHGELSALKEIQAKMEEEMTSLKEQITKQESEISELKSQLQEKDDQIDGAKKEASAENQKKAMLEAVGSKIKEQLDEKIKEMEELQSQNSQLQLENEQIEVQLKTAKDEYTQAKEELSVEKDNLKSLLDVKERENAEALSQVEMLQKSKEENEHKAEELGKLHQEKEDMVKQLQKEIDEIKNQSQEHQATSEQRQQELLNHQQAQDELKSQLEQIEQQKSDLAVEHAKLLEQTIAEHKQLLDSQTKAHSDELEKLNEEIKTHQQQNKTKTKENEDLSEEVQTLTEKVQKQQSKLEEAQSQIKNLEETEDHLKKQLEKVHSDLGMKVESGHDNIKQIVDIHKTNEDLSAQLLSKVEQNKSLEAKIKDLEAAVEDQKVAYDVLLDQISDATQKESELQGQNEKLEASKTDLTKERDELSEKCKNLEAESKKLQKQLDKMIKEQQRNSIGSDGDEYSSVAEMKESLKHAREMLSQFLQKLPYSDPTNEITLPIILSMFEFSKQEQDKLTNARKDFNQAKIAGEVQDKSKKLFGKMFAAKAKGKAGAGGNQSFNSGGTDPSGSSRHGTK